MSKVFVLSEKLDFTLDLINKLNDRIKQKTCILYHKLKQNNIIQEILLSLRGPIKKLGENGETEG